MEALSRLFPYSKTVAGLKASLLAVLKVKDPTADVSRRATARVPPIVKGNRSTLGNAWGELPCQVRFWTPDGWSSAVAIEGKAGVATGVRRGSAAVAIARRGSASIAVETKGSAVVAMARRGSAPITTERGESGLVSMERRGSGCVSMDRRGSGFVSMETHGSKLITMERKGSGVVPFATMVTSMMDLASAGFGGQHRRHLYMYSVLVVH